MNKKQKILVLGGTRLLGLSVVKRLASNDNNNITVISRHPTPKNLNVRSIVKERSEGLKILENNSFDITIDFIAYDSSVIDELFRLINPGHYILISTCWMVKLNQQISCDELISEKKYNDKKLPEITSNYLLGKNEIELKLYKYWLKDYYVNIIRLPIFWDVEDHTKRIHFYIERVLDENPIFIIDNEKNDVQICWVQDLSKALCDFLKYNTNNQLIWEALPAESMNTKKIVNCIAEAKKIGITFLHRKPDFFKQRIPEYLDNEPLWREKFINPTDHNIFNLTDTEITGMKIWLKFITKKILNNQQAFPISDLRKKEIEVINNL